MEVANRFKELDLIDRVPEELWMEVHDVVQEAVIKTIHPQEKEMEKAKWLFEEALQIAVNRRKANGKAEKDIFLELSCFFDDPVDVGNFMSDSCAFSKISLNIWKFTVHVLLKPSLENFEHYFTSM